ncbi:hypothetical protein OZX72_07315 [Bifidobacterium sp. ESL0769]|uniref:type II restriction enzyme n=1 Tax=Bifidobacterium sp. ESL0769 TaxID=2983229 RepID=UPI0023F80B67|nr:hypothetical protein [Bifidobacterium sp. ESL0769]WEV67046.1 hypothetical protein OZX72_07315 [Bifidobacterium sp. ESL0769]
MGNKYSAEEAWKLLLNDYNIKDKVSSNGYFDISADMIRKYREPRLMAKWDATESLPPCLRNANLNILPTSRKGYIVSDINLYKSFPPQSHDQSTHLDFPEFESISPQQISSESDAINVEIISHMLDDFLGTPDTVETFNGRMGTDDFDFYVDRFSGTSLHVNVDHAQLEIDGGFENDESIIIMEAKNVPHPDFHIRQLYYPYRRWLKRVQKPIRLVFSQYTNLIYHLFEYEFTDPNNYSSIHLVNQRSYTFEDTSITSDDLANLYEDTTVETDDNREDPANPPFIQADRFERVVAILEWLDDPSRERGVNSEDVAEYMNFDRRQGDYYLAAGEYLGLFDRSRRQHTVLTPLGHHLLSLPYRERQLGFVRQMLKHEIFHRLYGEIIDNGDYSSVDEIQSLMTDLNVCAPGATLRRRISSVDGWLHWICSLPDITDTE